MNIPLETNTDINLPQGFLLGAAISAHQVEGNNTNNDWWYFEQEGKLPKSGLACDHYNRYEEDFNLAKQIGLNSIRLSIEWSRIEPAEGQWSVSAIEHYKQVLRKLKELGFARMVTLHHYTLPKWLADRGGFENQQGIEAFARFSWFVAQNLGSEIDLWITINEPELFALTAFYLGIFPPFKKSFSKMFKVIKNLIAAHKAAFRAIKQVIPLAKIGIAKNNAYFEPGVDRFLDRLVVKIAKWVRNDFILKRIQNELDFIGLNYYSYRKLAFDRKQGFKILEEPSLPHSDVGWPIDPEGLYQLLKDLKKYDKPVYVTENGLADWQDNKRANFIRDHLFWVKKAIDWGIDVKGYFYWSLLDTFEWQDGFKPKYGLIEVDFENFTRAIRPSANTLKQFL